MIDLKNPTGWLKADLPELWRFVSDIDASLVARMKDADRLQELGAQVVPDKLRKSEFDNFDHEAFGDLKRVVAGRVKSEQPDPDDLLGKLCMANW